MKMTIKLNSLDRWTLLPRGKAIAFVGTDARRVRLHVNAQFECGLYIRFDGGEERFLAAVPAGLETVDFTAAGNFVVSPSDGEIEIWYQTAEDEPTYFENLDPVIFTKIIQRRKRNVDLELMMFKANQNAAVREAAMQREFSAQLDAIKASIVAPAPVPASKKDKANVAPRKTDKPVVPAEPEQDGGPSVAPESESEAGS
jgi:hypothetical protein